LIEGAHKLDTKTNEMEHVCSQAKYDGMAFLISVWPLLFEDGRFVNMITKTTHMPIIVLFHSNGEVFYIKKTHVLHGQKHIFSHFFVKKNSLHKVMKNFHNKN